MGMHRLVTKSLKHSVNTEMTKSVTEVYNDTFGQSCDVQRAPLSRLLSAKTDLPPSTSEGGWKMLSLLRLRPLVQNSPCTEPLLPWEGR